MTLTPDEITLLRYFELAERPFDLSDPDNEPLYVARKGLYDKGLLKFDRWVCLAESGRQVLAEIGEKP